MCNREDVIPSSVLHWNYRGFTEFPLRQLEGDADEITDIYLKENLISRLPSDIGRLERLESLYLSGNDIQELPVEIGKLVNLKCLDLSGNRLLRLPDEIGDVTSLKFLILDDNELIELPLRLAELKCLRYLSVCDNKLRWLPQRPVYNYQHCEFRFWRNTDLTNVPYSLWYHMFRGQQTRCLNIGCLGITKSQARPNRRSQLKIQTGELSWKIEIHVPSQYYYVIQTDSNSPSSLLELCKRKFYETLCIRAKGLTEEVNTRCSLYANCTEMDENGNDTSENIKLLNNNFSEMLTILNDQQEKQFKIYPTIQKGKTENRCRQRVKKRSYYVPSDLIEQYFDYIPKYIRTDLCNGPISRCENVSCKKPVFERPIYQFCIGKILLIDNAEEVILSAVFCSKSCAEVWKEGKERIIPWSLISSRHILCQSS